MKSILKDLGTTVFYVPSSLLHAEVADVNKLTYGSPEEFSVFFDKSLAFDLPPGSNAKVAVRYAKSNTLDSGWLLGASKIEGKAALVEAAARQRIGRPLRLRAAASRSDLCDVSTPVQCLA